MKKNKIIICILFFATRFTFSQSFEYVSPKENSTRVSLSNNIILKADQNIDKSSLSLNEFSVIGSKSGIHTGTVKLSDDNKTILFFPDAKFEANEFVSVLIKPGIKTIYNREFSQKTFHFTTTPLLHPINPEAILSNIGENTYSQNNFSNFNPSLLTGSVADTLPGDFPLIKVDSSDNPWDGKLFIANKPAASNSYGNYLIIADNAGSIVKYKKFGTAESNFRVLPNGELMTSENGRHIVLDTTLAPVDTFECGNGYTADSHDFLLLPNGHALIFATDPQPVDMSQIVQGGRTDATVIGAVIQELDASQNVVFQWRSFDYLPITDSYTDLTQKTIQYVHGNALDADNDGNILFSLRYFSSIIKINRKTGEIDWVLGGKENQFTFIGEHPENAPTYFSNQHNVNVLPNGNILLFDNGDTHKNEHDSSYSRGVEYEMDEQNKTVTMVWEYDHGKTIYTSSGGSIQRLPNGNTLIGWSRPEGNGDYHPIFTEVRDTNIVLEMSFTEQEKEFSYRAYKFPWASQASEVDYNIQRPLQGNIYPNPNNNNDTSKIGIHIKFDSLDADTYSEVYLKRYNYAPVNPTFSMDPPIITAHYFSFVQDGNINSYKGEFLVELKYFPKILDPAQTIVYARGQQGQQFIPLATSYDSAYNYQTKDLGKVLIVNLDTTYFGDFTFGVPQTVDSAYTPVPFSPQNADTVTTKFVEFRWGTRGIISTFHFQIAADSSFNSLVVDISGLASTVFTDTLLNEATFYYWRVNNSNSAGTSNWSNTSSFYISSIVGLKESNNILKDFKLFQNYPNPFNPLTTINYSVPETRRITLKVFDILGDEVAILVNEEKFAGHYSVKFDGSTLSSGVYFYQIRAGEFTDTKKFVLLK